MKTSQNAWVLSQIQKNGKVTRNQCIVNRITRLAARAADLRRAGFPIVGRRAGNDYEYVLEV